MAFRSLTRGLFQLVTHRRVCSTIFNRTALMPRAIVAMPMRSFASMQNNDDAYGDLSRFLDKEIQLEKSAQKHPSKLPTISGFEVQTKGPEVTLTRQNGDEKVTVTFNVTNTVNASDSGDDSMGQNPSSGNVDEAMAQASSQLKSRPSFTVDITRKAGGHTLSFLCSFLPDDYPDMSSADQKQQADEPTSNFEDFQIDEFAIHQGEWNEKVYSADCSVIDGELYDKLLNILEEHGIGEAFANQLMDFSTAYEHRQYIGLLEKLQQFTK